MVLWGISIIEFKECYCWPQKKWATAFGVCGFYLFHKRKSKTQKSKKEAPKAITGEFIIPEKQEETGYQLHVVDKKTGKTVNILDSVEDVQLLGMSLKIKSSEKQEWESAISPIQNFSQHRLVSLKNILNDMGPTAQKSLIEEAIQNVIDPSSNKDTFALPSHALMFTLLAMFAGKPHMIPKRLLSKKSTFNGKIWD
jgi:hypothetical protein